MTRTLALTLLVAGAMLVASPAFAVHNDDWLCRDTATTDAEDDMVVDTGPPPPCATGGGGLGGGGGRADAGGDRGPVALPTRIDAGAGGAAATGNLLGIGGILTGATTAAVAVARRRRRG